MNMSVYFQLFLSFLQVGMFSIGGGYAALPLIQDQVVYRHGWLSINEFSDLITIAEMTPGPIAVNSATFVGIRIAGLPGAMVATLGCICPSLILVSILARLYFKYREMKTLQHILECLRPVIVALIASACLSILQAVAAAESALAVGDFNLVGILIFAGAFLILRKSKLSPILVMLLCGCANLLIGMAAKLPFFSL